jgi:hypothetical protein
MARSTKHFLEVLDQFNHLGIEFISYRENIDTSDPLGRALMTIIGAIAELERNLIIERVRVGMRRARLDGRHIGRKPLDLDRVAIHRDRAAGHSLGELAKLHRISRANRRSASSSFPFRTHCWNLRWQVWSGGILLGKLAPLRPGAQPPQHAVQHGTRVVPRTAALAGPTLRPQHRFHHFPLLVSQFPTATHRHIRRSSEHPQNATNPHCNYL